MNNLKHILISRTDNIGDVILTLPLAGILKQHYPNVKITFLGRDYVRAITEHSAYIDDFLSWDMLSGMSESDAVAKIQSHQFDAVIHVYPRKSIGDLMKKAKVPYRIGPASRFYFWFRCNKLVRFSRRKSDLHEAQLNLNLLRPFQLKPNDDLLYLRDMMGFSSKKPLPSHLQSLLVPGKFNLIVHPFTNKNTREWPLSHFIEFINQLPPEKFNIIITGSEKENSIIQEKIMPHCPNVINAAGKSSLSEFIQLIAHVDGLVANSTGPMHLAAVLGIHSLGLFPLTKGMDTNRWAPIGEKAEVIRADPNCQQGTCAAVRDCFCMESITVDQVKQKILSWLHN
jgi:heptosyltransferase-3